jgi:hypothetical protein
MCTQHSIPLHTYSPCSQLHRWCCMMHLREEYRTYLWCYTVSYSRGHQCSGIRKITRHPHSYMCTQHSTPPPMYNLCSRLCWWVSVLLHDAFVRGISHLFTALYSLLSQGHQCGGIGINYQTHTYTVICAHNTIFLSAHTISVAGRVLAACHSHICHHFAVLTCTRNCFVSVYKVAVLRC